MIVSLKPIYPIIAAVQVISNSQLVSSLYIQRHRRMWRVSIRKWRVMILISYQALQVRLKSFVTALASLPQAPTSIESPLFDRPLADHLSHMRRQEILPFSPNRHPSLDELETFFSLHYGLGGDHDGEERPIFFD